METTLLFDSITAAQEVAYMLQAQWDECNQVIISNFDSFALETAVSLADTAYCKVGESCSIVLGCAELCSSGRKMWKPKQFGLTYSVSNTIPISTIYSSLNSLSQGRTNRFK